MGSSRPRDSIRADKALPGKLKPRRKPATSKTRKIRTAPDVPRDVQRVGKVRATAEQLRISPTQAVREMRDGVPATALREIRHRIDVALSVIGLCAAVLQAQMADYDSDIAGALKYCVGDVLDAQMERITTLLEGGAP